MEFKPIKCNKGINRVICKPATQLFVLCGSYCKLKDNDHNGHNVRGMSKALIRLQISVLSSEAIE
eukprot:scaffold27639_cov20-Tisochrysis_lutea.AAC.1